MQQVVVAACTSVGGTLDAPANWSATTGTWSGCSGSGGVPSSTDDVTINTKVTMDANGTAKSVTIAAEGILTSSATATANILTIAGNFSNGSTYAGTVPLLLRPISVIFSLCLVPPRLSSITLLLMLTPS